MADQESIIHLVNKKIPRNLALYMAASQVVYLFIPFFLILVLSLGILPMPRDNLGPDEAYGIGHGLVFFLAFISIFSIASSACTLGMFISFVSRTSLDSHDKYSNEDQKAMLLSLTMFGVIFGCLLVFMFIGGFIAGDLFPELATSGRGMRDIFFSMTDISSIAKLIVWSFVAGFSERLIPDLLKKFAAQIKDSSK